MKPKIFDFLSEKFNEIKSKLPKLPLPKQHQLPPPQPIKQIPFHSPIKTPYPDINLSTLLNPSKTSFTPNDWDQLPYLLQTPIPKEYRTEVYK